ncbi:hypothetical protein DFH09DRAFT_1104506 [Mycena vulgaris]|nr:hypothetical protein DFH09DRAFT_1104506 [Mycena vulgaris]
MSPTSYKTNEMKGSDVLFPRQNACQNRFHFWFHNRKVPRGIWPEDRKLLREIKLVDTWGAKIIGDELLAAYIPPYCWTRQETVDEEAVVVVKDGLRGISVSGCQTAMGYILGNRDCLQRFRRVTAEFDSITDSTSESGSKYPDTQPPPPSHFRKRQAETESLLSAVESWSSPTQELMNGLIDDQEILWREDMSHYGCSVCECLPVEESTIERHTWVQGDDTPTAYRLPLNAPCLSPMAHLRDGNVNPKPRAPNFVQDGLLCKSMRSTNILNPASSWANQLQALCKVDEFIWKARSSRTFRPQIEAIHDGKFSGALPPGSRGAEGHESCAQYILLTNRYRTINTG